MQISNVPVQFQPKYNSDYPGYSSGKNIEEIFFELFEKNKNDIHTEYIYLPVFWTSIYNIRTYDGNVDDLYNWLDTLDKTKKYFTIVQYACGISVKNFDLNILVFSAGGGGLNIKGDTTLKLFNYHGLNRYIFLGDKGDHDIPLICLPLFTEINIQKDIYCSFIGRYDTHKCRIDMREQLVNNNKISFFNSTSVEEYNKILNRSVFTLAPRGFGYTSFRLFEAILANSIPIYIWEDKKILPFNDIINWEEFCIVIHSSEISNLPKILEEANIQEIQMKLQNVKYMFNFEYTFKYIQQKILK